MKKVFFFVAMGVILNGCVQYSSFLGPAYTIIKTGNVYQAGFYYHSNIMIKKGLEEIHKKKAEKNTHAHSMRLVKKNNKEINLDKNPIALVESNIREIRKKFFLNK